MLNCTFIQLNRIGGYYTDNDRCRLREGTGQESPSSSSSSRSCYTAHKPCVRVKRRFHASAWHSFNRRINKRCTCETILSIIIKLIFSIGSWSGQTDCLPGQRINFLITSLHIISVTRDTYWYTRDNMLLEGGLCPIARLCCSPPPPPDWDLTLSWSIIYWICSCSTRGPTHFASQ